jgi:photosystem II stability/assembly factor-like uncharacterized protein
MSLCKILVLVNQNKSEENMLLKIKLISLTILILSVCALAQNIKIDSDTISGLGARNIGSAAMSGRVSTLDAVQEGKRITVYAGAASGGVWKSQNGGTTYKPVFDKQPVQSIGAITIDPNNSKTVWVGTGESWTRNSVSVGDGVYKSTDGGENWTNLGLKESERIAKVIVDPSDSNTVYVCATGKLWSDSDERGVYKTTDGGKTWNKVLKGANLSTGCSMLSIDEKNPKTVYAGMWDFRRKGWTFRSGGEDANSPSASSLFKSTDGGTTWSDLNAETAKGLPAKPWGRIAVTSAPSKPEVVYAFIEAEPPRNGLFRSDDSGKTWTAVDRGPNMIGRPFYFANLIVDPKDENKLYKAGFSLTMSSDGGKTFSNVSGGMHGDMHDVWINPNSTDSLICGDDGGIWYSQDGGNRWWKGENLPISQFYHVSTDNETPYRVYGGLQDNSSWVGDSSYPGGITNSRWENMYGGDGFWTFPDPSDPDYLYAEYQGGEIGRVNRKTLETRGIKPLAKYGESKLRYNWNTPIYLSPNQKGTIYLGSQFLQRSRDHGQTWERISPDLTTNDPAKQMQEQSGGINPDNSSAETHCTIYAIAESTKNPLVLWAGTDDGNLQITKDGGKIWKNVIGNIAGLPKNAWVSSLEASKFNAGTLYATFDLHTFGDINSYVYKTTDFGITWTALATKPMRGYAHVVREDTVNPDLLFVGTEFGLWVSLDGGKLWSQYKGGELPNVAVRDVVIQPRDNDLVIATHGRGIWIIDDISPLRSLSSDLMAKEAVFLQAMPTKQRIQASGGWSNGDAVFIGDNPLDDAVITYYQKKRHIFGDMKIEVFDAAGKLMATLPTSKKRGINRVTWGMRMNSPNVPPAASLANGTTVGPRVLPGIYMVKMTKDKNVYETKLNVQGDSRVTYNLADRKANLDLTMKVIATFDNMSYGVEKINSVKSALIDHSAKITNDAAFAKKLNDYANQVDIIRKKIVASKEGGMITGEERLREDLANLYASLVFAEFPPTQSQTVRADTLSRQLADVSKEFETWLAKELPNINSELAKRNLEVIKPLDRKDWKPSGTGGAAASMMEQYKRLRGLY